MAATMNFDQDQLLNHFNQAVCKRMAEEHAFLKALDEIFQAQRAEILRQGNENRLLRAMFHGSADSYGESVSETDDARVGQRAEQLVANGYDTPAESNDSPESGKCIKVGNDSHEDDSYSLAIIPDITIKEEADDLELKEDALPIPSHEELTNTSMKNEEDGDEDNSNSSGEPSKTRKRKSSTNRCFQCPFCKQQFSMWSSSKRRVVLDNGEKVYTCRDCKDTHNLMKSSHAYQKSPNHERPFQCNVCSKRFTQSNSLSCHMRTHTGERPFQCDVCHRGFARSDYLKAHKKIHNDEKQHVCAICAKEFREQRHLRYHLRMNHHFLDEAEVDDVMAAMSTAANEATADRNGDAALLTSRTKR